MKFRLIVQTIGSQMGLEDKLNHLLPAKPMIEPCGELTKLIFETGDLYIRSNIINTITVTPEREV